MTLEEINAKRRKGDTMLAAEKMGVTPTYADKLLRRKTAARHTEMLNVMTQIITLRENFLKNN